MNAKAREQTLRAMHATGALPQQMARDLGGSTKQLREELRALGIVPNRPTRWTAEEDAALLKMPLGASVDAIARQMNRTVDAVKTRRTNLRQGTATLPKFAGQARPCMCCTRKFRPKHKFNRLCELCRHNTPTRFDTPASMS